MFSTLCCGPAVALLCNLKHNQHQTLFVLYSTIFSFWHHTTIYSVPTRGNRHYPSMQGYFRTHLLQIKASTFLWDAASLTTHHTVTVFKPHCMYQCLLLWIPKLGTFHIRAGKYRFFYNSHTSMYVLYLDKITFFHIPNNKC